MPSRVPIEQRRHIVRLFIEGTTQWESCHLTGRSRTSVSRIIQAYRDDQGRLIDAERSGRPKVTSEEQELLIVAAAVADPLLSAKEIRQELSLNVSCETIRRRLKEAGLGSCVAAQKPHLTDRQRLEKAGVRPGSGAMDNGRVEGSYIHRRIDFLHSLGSTAACLASDELQVRN